jgi:Surface-adhesin protein E
MPFTIRPHRRFLPLVYCSGVWSLVTLLVLSSGTAYAEWVEVGGKVEEGQTEYTVYVDPDTIDRSGDVVKLWVLMDFKTTQIVPKPPHMSVKSQREFDCTKDHMRVLAITAFSGNMATGKAVYSSSDFKDHGSLFEPRSVAHRLWKFVCGKQ